MAWHREQDCQRHARARARRASPPRPRHRAKRYIGKARYIRTEDLTTA
jgi:hypothetical protein